VKVGLPGFVLASSAVKGLLESLYMRRNMVICKSCVLFIVLLYEALSSEKHT
jgi:hypothetical protein